MILATYLATNLKKQIEQAMWDGDLEKLQELAPCVCCCFEHTFESCPARLWEGCRGTGSLTRADIQKWADHYGMTLSQFYDSGENCN